jgi:hypothetical protein
MTGELRLYAVPEPLHWIVCVEFEGRIVREMNVGRDVALSDSAAVEHAERCLRGEIAEGVWSPPQR